MTSKVFVDTNIFVALRNQNDPTHKKALQLLRRLTKNGCELFTSSDVICETLTVLSRKLGKEHALEFEKEIGDMAFEIFIDEELHKQARKVFLSTKSKNISFIDCSSVVAMQSVKMTTAFSFDQHFKKLGINLLK